jgi:predicted nuclease of predicted toxin-antitoxin system
MKVLLDVCTPVQVRQALPGHDVHTAVMMGWGELENGDLLREAEAAGFDLLIICDKNLRHQQNLTGRRLAILELWTNHRPTLEKHWPLIGETAQAMQPAEYRAFEAP